MSDTSRPSAAPIESASDSVSAPRLDFIRSIVAEDLRAGQNGGRLVTRFPPEPNGFLHIGHATSVCLNFGIAEEMGGVCNLRFDDTNPETEEVQFVDAIMRDVSWLGFDWTDRLFFASDYFEQMYEFAEYLIREGKAYVDSLDDEEIREYRGTVTEAGKPSPYRERSVEENLDLFRRMQAGEFPNGAHVLRAKLDLASPNMLLRDPVLYRIRHAHHYRTGDRWRVYPLYDYAHPIEDALECVTHSICTLEFENNRPLYDWVVENIPVTCRPRQYEFARRNLDYTVMSKRKLLELVRGGHVRGWDDPRMPTIAGLRRRGFTPSSIRSFADLAGVGKTENRIDIGKLEFAIRDELNQTAPRVLCVLRPLRVVLTNYPDGETEQLDAPYFPRDIGREGSRSVPFAREIYIDRDDFNENPPPDYHRLAPGRSVRLRYAFVIRCDEVIRDSSGEIAELRCTYDPETRGGKSPEGRVKGTIHWVSVAHSIPCEVRLYDRLFTIPDPEEGEEDFKKFLNPESLVVVESARIEPSVTSDPEDTRYQFERLGYFWRDPIDSRADAPVFNRTVTLREAVGRHAQDAEGAQEAVSRPPLRKARSRQETDGIEEKAIVPERSRALEGRRKELETMGVGPIEAEIITRSEATDSLFAEALGEGASARGVANWLVHELGRDTPDAPVGGRPLGRLVGLVEEGTLSSSAAREVLREMIETGDDPEVIVERLGLRQVSDESLLSPIVQAVIEEFPGKAEEYRGGRSGLLGFFVGQVMRRTEGRGNPEVVKQLLEAALEGR